MTKNEVITNSWTNKSYEEKFDYDRETWNIFNKNNITFFERYDSIYSIQLKRNWIESIKQISENEFLLYYFIGTPIESKYELVRITIDGYNLEKKYTKVFNKCYFLSNDVIFFDKKYVGDIHKYTAYSIKENKELKELNWLTVGYDNSSKVSNGCYLSVVDISEKDDDNNIAIEATKVLKSSSEENDDYIKFLVDSKKFKPIGKVHSTLRDKDIAVRSEEDVIRIISEDIEYKKIVDANLSRINTLSDDSEQKKLSEKQKYRVIK